MQLGNGTPSRLLDYPSHSYSSMRSGGTVSGSSIMTVRDFSQFLIIDRIGLPVELVSHLFGTVAQRPIGARGLYSHWRHTSLVLNGSSFKTLKVK